MVVWSLARAPPPCGSLTVWQPEPCHYQVPFTDLQLAELTDVLPWQPNLVLFLMVLQATMSFWQGGLDEGDPVSVPNPINNWIKVS